MNYIIGVSIIIGIVTCVLVASFKIIKEAAETWNDELDD